MENKEYQLIVNAIAATLHHQALGLENVAINWQKVFALSKFQSITPMLTEALLTLPDDQKPPKEILDQCKQQTKLSAMKDMTQSFEGERLFSLFEQQQIPYLPLKGWLLKDLYPRRELRTMSDIDVLIHKEDAEKVHDLMIEEGYEVMYYQKTNHDVYHKKPYLGIEIHTALFSEETPYPYFHEIWSHLQHDQNTYRYHMTKNDLYCYLILHMHKHYKNAGTGIRSIADIYVFLKAYQSQLDFSYIERVLSSVHVLNFHKEIKALAYYWFEDGPATSESDAIGNFILSSGTYGVKSTTLNRKMLQPQHTSNLTQKKLIYILHRLFPDQERLGHLFPIVKKHSFLIPFFWIVRFFIKVPGNLHKIRLETHKLKTFDEKEAEKQKQIDNII